MLRSFAVVFALALAASPPAYAATGFAAAGDFGAYSIEKGSQRDLVIDVRWEDDSPRDVTAAAGVLTVYSKPPVNGVGGVMLFQKALAPIGSSHPTQLACRILASDVAVPGTYYAEVVVIDGSDRDPLHGTIVVTGR